MTHEELETAVPVYAVGALERAERQSLEAHLLSGCASCHAALKEYQSVAVMLPFGLHITTPPRALKAKLMARRLPSVTVEAVVHSPEKPHLEPGEWMNHFFPPDSSPRHSAFGWTLGLGAIAILALGGYLAWNVSQIITEDTAKLAQLQAQADAAGSKLAVLQQQLNEREQSLTQIRDELRYRAFNAAELKDQLIQREVELEATKMQLAQQSEHRAHTPQDELAVLLRTPKIKAISLAGTDRAKQATGVLLYDPRTQKIWLYSVNLPESTNGMTYQIWAIYEKPVSVGLFHLDRGETANLFVKPMPTFTSAKKFAVSLEPPGGRPEPTGPLYLISQS